MTPTPTTLMWKIDRASEGDLGVVLEHLVGLDQETLRCRFGGAVSKESLSRHVESAREPDTTIFVCRVGGTVRGIGELRRFESGRHVQAEAAFTVEAAHRDLGIGTALMAALIEQARRAGVHQVIVCFPGGNQRMRRIAEKFHAVVSHEEGDCVGHISIRAENKCELGANGPDGVAAEDLLRNIAIAALECRPFDEGGPLVRRM